MAERIRQSYFELGVLSLFDVTNLSAGEIALYRDDEGRLIPADGESVERFAKMKAGEPYIFTMKRERNYKFLKKYFMLLNCAYQNQELFADSEWFRKHTLIGIGHCETRIDPFSGSVYFEAKSVSFAKCKEPEFDSIYRKTVTFLVEKYGFDDNFVNLVLGFL